MNLEQAKEQVKTFLREEVESVTTPSPEAGKNKYDCPFCGSGTGKNGTGALSLNESTDFTTWHCFVCGRGGDIIDFIKEHRNLNDKQAFKYAYDKYHIVVDEVGPKEKKDT